MNNRANRIKYRVLTRFIYTKKFMSIGREALILKPLQFTDVCSVIIGKHSFIAEGAWIIGEKTGHDATLVVGDHVQIGHLAHIVAKKKVVIEDSVLIADKVYISDCKHNYENIYIPVADQGIGIIGEVIIGEGSWIGENVCIIGSKIGKHCIVGANSVVTKNIPDYCVAVGSPARIIKQYDFARKMWEKI